MRNSIGIEITGICHYKKKKLPVFVSPLNIYELDPCIKQIYLRQFLVTRSL
jgi:hypothetical protein